MASHTSVRSVPSWTQMVCHIGHSFLSTLLLLLLVLLCSSFVWVPSCNSFPYGSSGWLLVRVSQIFFLLLVCSPSGLFTWPLLYGGTGPSVWLLVVLFCFYSKVLLFDYGSFVLLLMALLGGYFCCLILLVLMVLLSCSLWSSWVAPYSSFILLILFLITPALCVFSDCLGLIPVIPERSLRTTGFHQQTSIIDGPCNIL